jgi:hypothetical protein
MATPPGAGMQALAGLVQDRLVGRTVSLDWAGHVVTGTLVSLDVDPGSAGLLAGQFENVRLVARDLDWQGRRVRELTVTGCNVHMRPGRVALLVAAPVEVVAVVSRDELGSWLTEVPERYRLWLDEDGAACASLRRFPDVGHVEFEPLVAGRWSRSASGSPPVRPEPPRSPDPTARAVVRTGQIAGEPDCPSRQHASRGGPGRHAPDRVPSAAVSGATRAVCRPRPPRRQPDRDSGTLLAARKSEDPFRDDVELDLAGAAADEYGWKG